ncbi:tudor domain-containing protein 3-like [Mya arenaria]|uniref:tudor domain-containing protein 3-like n=1 Tax=Mya arenaria TaxID=6604 RepID=UPI0022DF644B|nr:tudor domain-containing protein 3-like [Mya arenaria]
MAGVSLQDRGWYLTGEGIAQCTQTGKSDVDSIIKSALDIDLREIGKGWLPEDVNRGKADYVQGPGVLQLQKIRNVSAPKDNEDSQAAPRIFKFSLTDGHVTCNAVETENLNGVSMSTAPGTKIFLKVTVDVEHGFLLLNNKNAKSLGGRVDKLAEGWELKRKLAKQSRATFNTDGGPPLFVPFGQRISTDAYKAQPKRDNFKSLETLKGDKDKTRAEEIEFEAQRKATIAEALQAKEDGLTKKFGGGTKVNDRDIAKIVEMGFQAEDATSALKQSGGNFQQALDSLLSGRVLPGRSGFGRGGPNRQGSYESDRGRGGRRERRDDDTGGGGRGRRGRDQEETGDASSRPSGPATLFDFLNKKIPIGDTKGESKSMITKSTSDQLPQNDTRDHRNYSQTNIDQSYRSKQAEPPRFSQKPRQQGSGGQGQFNRGRNYDNQSGSEGSERSQNDQRPKTSTSDSRNFDKRNMDRSYVDRNDRNKGRGDNGFSDRRNNFNEGDGRRGGGGGRDGRSERDRDFRPGDRRNQYDNQKSANNSSKPSANNYNQRSREDQTDNKSSSQRYEKPDDSQKRDSQFRKPDRTDKGTDRPKNQQKNQNQKPDSSQNRDSYNDQKYNNRQQDSYSKEGNLRQKSQSNKGGNSQTSDDINNFSQSYPQVVQTSYNDYNMNNNAVASSCAAQFSPEYVYTDIPQAVSPTMTQFSIKQGDRVMARYWEDGNFYNAQIAVLPRDMSTCVVTFTEYGNTEEVRLTDIRPLPQLMAQMGGNMMQPDMSMPPPQMYYSAPAPLGSPGGMEEVIQGMGSMEFRRGGGGQPYQARDNRPQQQYYQPPPQRR